MEDDFDSRAFELKTGMHDLKSKVEALDLSDFDLEKEMRESVAVIKGEGTEVISCDES